MTHNRTNNYLIDKIKKKAASNHARIGFGVDRISEPIIESIRTAREFADIVLVGDRNLTPPDIDVEIIHAEDAPRTLIDLLIKNKIDGAVRGTLSATKTLSNLKRSIGAEKLYRIALLETTDGIPFFFAPVGIDEGSSLSSKMELIIRGVSLIRRFGIEPKVGILSGGRFEDVGRDPYVDRTLADADFIENRLREKNINARHYSILIEDAIKEADFIIAPDGISGNLMFRTLVFLGNGKGYGAPVLTERVFVDTSRAGDDYSRAIMMAGALVQL